MEAAQRGRKYISGRLYQKTRNSWGIGTKLYINFSTRTRVIRVISSEIWIYMQGTELYTSPEWSELLVYVRSRCWEVEQNKICPPQMERSDDIKLASDVVISSTSCYRSKAVPLSTLTPHSRLNVIANWDCGTGHIIHFVKLTHTVTSQEVYF